MRELAGRGQVTKGSARCRPITWTDPGSPRGARETEPFRGTKVETESLTRQLLEGQPGLAADTEERR